MNRKLRQCPVCKEWFNTTGDIMLEHHRIKHPRFYAAIRIAAGIYSLTTFFSPVRPWVLQSKAAPGATYQWRNRQ